jgi:hypothetical protein
LYVVANRLNIITVADLVRCDDDDGNINGDVEKLDVLVERSSCDGDKNRLPSLSLPLSPSTPSQQRALRSLPLERGWKRGSGSGEG